MAEITKEVEDVFDALPEISPRTRAYIAAKFALLYAHRLASPELAALGEAAVNLHQALGDAEIDVPWDERQDLFSAARTYAQSIKGEDDGKR